MDHTFIQHASQNVDRLAYELGGKHFLVLQFRAAIRNRNTQDFFRAMTRAGNYPDGVQEAFVRAFG